MTRTMHKGQVIFCMKVLRSFFKSDSRPSASLASLASYATDPKDMPFFAKFVIFPNLHFQKVFHRLEKASHRYLWKTLLIMWKTR